MNTGLKKKTIKSILKKRVGDWIRSLPEDLQERAKRDTIVTGGCIASMLLGEKINDIDIYFTTQSTTKAIAEYYVTRFKEIREKRGGINVPVYVEEMKDVRGDPRVRIVVKSAGVDKSSGGRDYSYFETRPPEEAGDYVSEVYDDPVVVADIEDEIRESMEALAAGEDEQEAKEPFRPVFLSSNAITLSRKIQIVIRFFGEPDAIHANYDFAHCTNYWRCSTGDLVLRPEALTALLSRSLVYQGSRYPIASVVRLRKFIERGWRVNAGQILKMAMQISKLDLEQVAVLEDQLTGVDVAYFAQVIQAAKDKDAERIETAYLVEIIDRMFGD